MAKNTWKIGEWAIGGTIKIESAPNGKSVKISFCDYNTNKPLEGWEKTCTSERSADDFLNEGTSSFYAEKVMNWINEHCKLQSFDW